jgi:hypothetical protein
VLEEESERGPQRDRPGSQRQHNYLSVHWNGLSKLAPTPFFNRHILLITCESMKRRITALTALLISCTGLHAENRNIEQIGVYQNYWGQATGMGWIGDQLFLTTQTGLKILDYSDYRNPSVPWQLNLGQSIPKLAKARDGIIFLVDQFDSLRLVTVTREGEPVLAGTLQLSTGTTDLTPGEGILVVTSAEHGVEVVSVGDPDHPVIVGRIGAGIGSSEAYGVALDVNLAFALCRDPRSDSTALVAIQIHRPDSLTVISRLTLPVSNERIAYSNGYLYTAGGRSRELIAIDVRDPWEPALVCRFDQGPGLFSSLELWSPAPGEWEFAFRVAGGILEIDNIGAPGRIERHGYHNVGIVATGTAIRDTLLAVYSRDQGVILLSFNEMIQFTALSSINRSVQIVTIEALDDIVYGLDGRGKLMTFDFQDRSNPALRSSVSLNAGYTRLRRARNTLFCTPNHRGEGNRCLVFPLIENLPGGSFYPAGLGNLSFLDFHGDYLVASGGRVFGIYQILQMYQPISFRAIYNLDYIEEPGRLCWIGDYIYLLAGDSSTALWVLDASFPDRPDPRRRDQLEIRDVKFVQGSPFGLVLGTDHEIQLYDISSPLEATEKFRIETDGLLHDLIVDSNHLIYADSAIHILDIGDLEHPVERGFWHGDLLPLDLALNHREGELFSAEGTRVAMYDITAALDAPSGHNAASVPLAFNLAPPYPNPFNSTVTITYSIPPVFTQFDLAVFDLLGRRIAGLIPESPEDLPDAGVQQVIWNAKENPAGLYFVRLKAGQQIVTERLWLVK